MKATLTFDLPEENDEHSYAVNGWRYALVLNDLNEWLRTQIKHGEMKDGARAAMQTVRDKLHEIAYENEVKV